MDDFRGLAIVLVVLVHMSSPALPASYYYVVKDASVFFIFLSGFFARYLYRDAEPATAFWRRKALRIVAPYLVACVPGLLWVWWNHEQPFDLSYLIWTIATGEGHKNGVHWYAPFIVLIFAAYPLWRYLIRRPRLLTAGTMIAVLVGLFTFRSRGNANPLISFVHFGGVFMAGLLAAQYHQALVSLLRRRFWLVMAAGLSLWTLTLPLIGRTWGLNMEDVLARGIVAVDVSLLSKLALVLPLMATFHRLWELEWSPPLLKPLAKLSYGIFYWHYYVFLASGRVISRLMPQNTIWAVGLQTLVVFAAVIAFLNLAKRLWPRFSPYLGVD